MKSRRNWLLTAIPASFCAVAFGQKSATDDSIYDQVRLKLVSDTDVQGGAIDVDVKAGVVTLKGKVRTEKAKDKAERLTKRVKGVKSVVNQLVIDNT